MTVQTTLTPTKPNTPSRTFACAKCGSPITVYPPDDIHKIASRERTSFLETVESIRTCSKCNETTRLYWGKPVFYRILVLLARRLATVARNATALLPLNRLRIQRSRGASQESPAMSDDEREEIENGLIDYIAENGGAIVPSRAAEELGISPELVKESIDRMMVDGRLKQTTSNEITAQQSTV